VNALPSAEMERLRSLASGIRGGMFTVCVRDLVLRLHDVPISEREALIADKAHWYRAIIQCDATVDEFPFLEGLQDYGGAVIADALDMLMKMPAAGGRA
jgi:hypothetical protein